MPAQGSDRRPVHDSYGDSLGGGGPTQGPASAGAWHLASAFNRGAQGVPSHNEQWALPGASPWGPAGDPGTLRWRGGGGNQRPPGPLGGGHIGIERDGGYYAETVNHMIEECTDAAEGGLPRGGKGPESDPLGLLQEDKEMLLKRGIAGGSGTPGVAGEGVSNLEVYRVSAGHEQAAPGAAAAQTADASERLHWALGEKGPFAFTDVHPIPSIEIRRHVILVCLPPITCFVLKDTVYLLVTEDLRADELIYQLCRLSRYYAFIAQYAVSAAVTGFEGAAPRLQANTNSVPEESKNPQPVQAQATQTPEGAFEGISSAHPQQPPKVPPPPLRGPPGGTSGGHRQSGGDTSGDGRGPLPGGDWEGKGEGAQPLIARSCCSVGSNSGQSHKLPFEFAALECIFFAAFQQLNADILYLESKFSEAQHRTRTKGELLSLLMEDLHALKEPISLYQDRVDAFDKAFDELISNNTYLQRMELSKYARHPHLYEEPTEKESVNPDLEILLEYFDQEIDQFKIRVRHLKGSIEDSERLLTLRLAVMRNSLIKSELAATLLAAGLAVGTSISGIFGMNLQNGNEEGAQSHNIFVLVSSVIAFSAVLSLLAVLYLVKTIRL
ncbi:uncharacterized protein LOC34621675 [Cyclospora cayetanensis]|uniref:Uncharacterized protein LOC34621675 n=1 Tax=Cyclospora cayetanensis TaxID=88456 RepID=A0A6P6S0D0_9EIME|nr:uncharacterized protein LOC34621675 [Cyclospora cayetanensis]